MWVKPVVPVGRFSRFLKLDLSERPAIKGQLERPICFEMNVLDQANGRSFLTILLGAWP